MVKKSDIMNYLNLGLSVFPCSRYKKPMIKSWEEYQQRLATEKEVDGWIEEFKEIPAIALVTGELSGILLIDIDIPCITIDNIYNNSIYIIIREILGNDRKNDRIFSRTPRGGLHIWTKYPKGSGIRNSASKIFQNVDIRGEGGYVLIPPSSAYNKDLLDNGIKKLEKYTYENLNGTITENIKCLSEISKTGQEKLKSVILSATYGNKSATKALQSATSATMTEKMTDFFQENKNRDDSLFKVGMALLDGNCNFRLAEETIFRLAMSCNFPEKEAMQKVESCLKRQDRKIEHLTDEIKEYIENTNGWFSSKDIYHDLGVCDTANKKKIRTVMSRFVKDSIIEKSKNKDGIFRRIDSDIDIIDIFAPLPERKNIWLPLGLDKLCYLNPKNLMVIAGVSNTGKTTWLLNIAKNNQKVTYATSEMGGTELQDRLSAFDGGKDDFKHVRFVDRSDNFVDIIDPDGITIIDFLETTDEHWKVVGIFKDIYMKLNNGICIIAIQKDPKKVFGVGGAGTLNKPRIYINLDYNQQGSRAKIVKAKNWAIKTENPNNMVLDYHIFKGAKLEPITEWHKENDNKPYINPDWV